MATLMGPSCRLEVLNVRRKAKLCFHWPKFSITEIPMGRNPIGSGDWVSDRKVPANIAVDLVSRYVLISVDSESFKMGRRVAVLHVGCL